MADVSPINFETAFDSLKAAGEQTALAPSLTPTQRSRAVGLQMLMGYLDLPVSPEEAQEAILEMDLDRARVAGEKTRPQPLVDSSYPPGHPDYYVHDPAIAEAIAEYYNGGPLSVDPHADERSQ